jgi:serine/threonine protein kinase
MTDANKNLTESQIKYVIRETLEALAYLHDKCIILIKQRIHTRKISNHFKIKLLFNNFGKIQRNHSACPKTAKVRKKPGKGDFMAEKGAKMRKKT